MLWSSACQTEPPTTICCIVFLVKLPGSRFSEVHEYQLKYHWLRNTSWAFVLAWEKQGIKHTMNKQTSFIVDLFFALPCSQSYTVQCILSWEYTSLDTIALTSQ